MKYQLYWHTKKSKFNSGYIQECIVHTHTPNVFCLKHCKLIFQRHLCGFCPVSSRYNGSAVVCSRSTNCNLIEINADIQHLFVAPVEPSTLNVIHLLDFFPMLPVLHRITFSDTSIFILFLLTAFHLKFQLEDLIIVFLLVFAKTPWSDSAVFGWQHIIIIGSHSNRVRLSSPFHGVIYLWVCRCL